MHQFVAGAVPLDQHSSGVSSFVVTHSLHHCRPLHKHSANLTFASLFPVQINLPLPQQTRADRLVLAWKQWYSSNRQANALIDKRVLFNQFSSHKHNHPWHRRLNQAHNSPQSATKRLTILCQCQFAADVVTDRQTLSKWIVLVSTNLPFTECHFIEQLWFIADNKLFCLSLLFGTSLNIAAANGTLNLHYLWMCQVCALFVRLAICARIRSGRNWEMFRLFVNRLKFCCKELKTPFIARPAPSAEVCNWRDIWRPSVSKRPVAFDSNRLKSGWGFQFICRRLRLRDKVETEADDSSAVISSVQSQWGERLCERLAMAGNYIK